MGRIFSINKLLTKVLLSYFDIIKLAIFARGKLGIPILKWSSYSVIVRIFNTVTMFLPLKLLLVLSGAASVGFLDEIKDTIGVKFYVFSVVCALFFLYIFNVLFNRYVEKGLARDISSIHNLKGKFFPLGKRAGHKALTVFSDISVKVLSDFLFIIILSLPMLMISIHYFIFYFSMFMLFLLLVEYLVFTNNRYNFLDKMSLTNATIIGFISVLIYYFCFIFIIVLQMSGKVTFFEAIVLLILSKVTNSSFKSVVGKTYILRSKFGHIMSCGIS
ncbi:MULTISPECIES: hypothetical protein [unclassified Vibrio]|uniref:hypothetical protein n=1 Tax=unclassified Vibrio TaxID=2614977 RepID=UPI00354BAC13